MAGHELNPNRGVKRRSHTACMSVCDLSISQSPNLRSSAAMYLLHGNTAGAGQHRLIRSAPSRPADVAVAQNDLPPSCATGPGPVAHPASRSMTSPAPSVTVMIRPAADETTTRDLRGVRWAKQVQAGTSCSWLMRDASHSQMDRLRPSYDYEVKTRRACSGVAAAQRACNAFWTRRRDGLTTTTATAAAAERCWSCLSRRADTSLHASVGRTEVGRRTRTSEHGLKHGTRTVTHDDRCVV